MRGPCVLESFRNLSFTNGGGLFVDGPKRYPTARECIIVGQARARLTAGPPLVSNHSFRPIGMATSPVFGTENLPNVKHVIWAIYNDLSRGHPKWWFSKGIHPKMALN